jgi:hypothetical protein
MQAHACVKQCILNVHDDRNSGIDLKQRSNITTVATVAPIYYKTSLTTIKEVAPNR